MSITLGMPANAASAHGHEFNGKTETQPNPNWHHPLQQTMQYLHSTIQTIWPGHGGKAQESIVHTEVAAPQAPATAAAAPTVASPSTVQSRTHRSTQYALAQPPPGARNQNRLHGKPKKLLQLRRVAKERGAAPVIEVFPAQMMGNSIKKKLSKLVGNSQEKDDLLILDCEGYSEAADDASMSSDDEDLAERNVVASVRKLAEDKAEIVIGDRSWTASRIERGYEFKTEGSVVRWLIRKPKKAASAKKFKFVLVSQSGRKTTVGTMNAQSISVVDEYRAPSEGSAAAGIEDELSVTTTSQELTSLVLVTGIWVAIGEGWSLALSGYLDSLGAPSSPPSTPFSPSSSTHRLSLSRLHNRRNSSPPPSSSAEPSPLGLVPGQPKATPKRPASMSIPPAGSGPASSPLAAATSNHNRARSLEIPAAAAATATADPRRVSIGVVPSTQGMLSPTPAAGAQISNPRRRSRIASVPPEPAIPEGRSVDAEGNFLGSESEDETESEPISPVAEQPAAAAAFAAAPALAVTAKPAAQEQGEERLGRRTKLMRFLSRRGRVGSK